MKKKNILSGRVIPIFLITLFCGDAAFSQTCVTYISNLTPDSRYQPQGNEVVIDLKTNLMWMKCSIGKTGDSCLGSAARFTWQNALKFVEPSPNAFSHAGYDDWRLPNVKELVSLVAFNCYNPSINGTIFPRTISADYWTSTPHVNSGSSSLKVSFLSGKPGGRNRDNTYFVRLVRNP
jgi:hypothetical protein